MSVWQQIISDGEADVLLKAYRITADRIMVAVIVFMTVVCLAVSFIHDTQVVSLLVALPTLALAYGLMRWQSGELMTRLYMGCAFMAYTSLLIHESYGDIEAHFSAFGLIGVLLYYRDWRTIASATVFIYLQHLVGGYAQSLGAPIYVFDTPLFWQTFFIHVAYFLPFVGMMSFLSIWLKREGVVQQRIIEKAQEKEVALREATNRSEVANRLKGQFLANMSHEIRTPLNGVNGMLELALDTDLTSQQKDYLQVAKDSSEHLLALLNDILDFSRMESGALELVMAPTHLRHMLDSLAKVFEPMATERGLAFTTHCDDNVPMLVMADATRIRQIAINLISNAIKYTPSGWVRVELFVSHDDMQPSAPKLNLVVKDSGQGFAPEAIAHIFSPFVQVDSSSTRSHGGVGLGLAISRSLVHLMGGEIRAHGAVNKGASFFVTLPCKACDEASNPHRVAASNVQPKASSLHVLVAEDHPVNQKVIALMLGKLGHRATLVNDGAAAIECLKERQFDLLLLDVMMPIRDGMDVLAFCRNQEADATIRTPIIMVTAHAMSGDAEKFLEAGADGYLPKPVGMDNLAQEMTRVMQAHADRSA